MKRNRFRFQLSLLMIGLLLAKSSMAVEWLAHDSHGHELNEVSLQLVMQVHDSEEPESVFEHGKHAIDEPLHSDCTCEDLCCLTLAEFTVVAIAHLTHRFGNEHTHRRNYYQSVSLDLAVPPPNS